MRRSFGFGLALSLFPASFLFGSFGCGAPQVDDSEDCQRFHTCAPPEARPCPPEFECLGNPPEGWKGYFRLHFLDYPQTPEQRTCLAGDRYFAAPGGPAQCSPCACAPEPTTIPPVVRCWGEKTDCKSVTWQDMTIDYANPPDCGHALTLVMPKECMLLSEVEAKEKPLAESQATISPRWGVIIDTCDLPPREGCASGACFDKTTNVCISHEGNVSCPEGWVGPIIGYRNIGEDTRACSECTCSWTGAPDPITISNDTSCSGGDALLERGECVNIKADKAWSFSELNIQWKKPIPLGGDPIGGIPLNGATTLCCK